MNFLPYSLCGIIFCAQVLYLKVRLSKNALYLACLQIYNSDSRRHIAIFFENVLSSAEGDTFKATLCEKFMIFPIYLNGPTGVRSLDLSFSATNKQKTQRISIIRPFLAAFLFGFRFYHEFLECFR